MIEVKPTLPANNLDRLADLNTYLSEGIHSVQGWCVPHLWQSIWPLAQHIGDGPIAEIGVYEGKFFIGLCKTFGIGANHKACAIDVFDMQQFNLDGAGKGRLDKLTENAERAGTQRQHLHIIKEDSLALRDHHVDAFRRDVGECAFFSVDGCHEVVHTIHDTEFAMKVTRNDGIIAVDDYTNSDWPGVQEAIARMYLMNSYAFVPLAVTCNKLLLCSYSYHQQYLALLNTYLADHFPTTRTKRVKRFGFDTLTIQPAFQSWVDLT
jgi:hypothetical protein